MIGPLFHTRHGYGPATLLLHPLGMDHHFWDRVITELPGLDTLRVDLPGHGATAVPDGPYRIADLADSVAELVAGLGVKGVHVVGVSLGGLVAQHLAATRPDLVRTAVLANTVPVYPEPMRGTWTERARSARERGLSDLIEPTAKVWFTDRLALEDPARRLLSSSLHRIAPEGYALACEALAAADLRELSATIKVPVLALCGMEEPAAFTDAVDWFAANLPRVEVHRVPAASHGAALENPADFAAAVSRFVRAGWA